MATTADYGTPTSPLNAPSHSAWAAAVHNAIVGGHPDSVSFKVGTLAFGTGQQRGWLTLGGAGGFQGSIEISITGSWNYNACFGVQTRRTDFYWDGARQFSLGGDKTMPGTSSNAGQLGISEFYGIGTVGLGAVGDDKIYWPIYKRAGTPGGGDDIDVLVRIVDPNVTEAIKPRFALGQPTALTHNKQPYGATGWITASLLNGWNNGTYGRPLRYRRTTDNIVYLSGHVTGGSSGTAAITVLPTGFRPGYNSNFIIIGDLPGAAEGCSVDTAGTVALTLLAQNSWSCLDSISFYAEPQT